jgi:hypothetical protein
MLISFHYEVTTAPVTRRYSTVHIKSLNILPKSDSHCDNFYYNKVLGILKISGTFYDLCAKNEEVMEKLCVCFISQTTCQISMKYNNGELKVV